MQMVYSELATSEVGNLGQRSHQQCNWCTLDNNRRQMDSGQTRKFEWTRSQFFHCHLRRAQIQMERITKQDINEFGATVGCPGCSAIKCQCERRVNLSCAVRDTRKHRPTTVTCVLSRTVGVPSSFVLLCLFFFLLLSSLF